MDLWLQTAFSEERELCILCITLAYYTSTIVCILGLLYGYNVDSNVLVKESTSHGKTFTDSSRKSAPIRLEHACH